MTEKSESDKKFEVEMRSLWRDYLGLWRREVGWHRIWVWPVALLLGLVGLAIILILASFSILISVLEVAGKAAVQGAGFMLGVIILLKILGGLPA